MVVEEHFREDVTEGFVQLAKDRIDRQMAK